MKDYKTILAAYDFTDPQGHSLEHCADLLDLIDEFLHGTEGDIAPTRIARSGDVLREAVEDAQEVFENISKILRGEATESPLDPENELRFII